MAGVRARATAGPARGFRADVPERRPFPRRAVPAAGGSAFRAAFETACQERGRARFVLPPRSPKRNGHVERTTGTARRQFWERDDGDLARLPRQAALRAWEHEDHHVRPHHARDSRTPAQPLAALGTPQRSRTS